MEHLTLWIAFWIVTLSGCRPTGNQIPPMEDSNIESLLESLKCPNDSKFYTPSTEGDCIIAALKCFKIELNGTVRAECEDPERKIEKAVEFLGIVIDVVSNMNSTAPTNSTECRCERWPTTNITSFLNAIVTPLQRIQSDKAQIK